MIAFIDFEASSLQTGSYPIEVGWAVDSGSTDSMLIHPADGWDDWSQAAEAVHGISRATLEVQGLPVETVAGAIADLLATVPDVVLASDAPAWDQAWLDRLLRAGGVDCGAKVQSAERLYLEVASRLQRLAPPATATWHTKVLRALKAEAAGLVGDVHAAELQRRRVRHRAGSDAEGKLWILKELRIRVDARLAAAGMTSTVRNEFDVGGMPLDPAQS